MFGFESTEEELNSGEAVFDEEDFVGKERKRGSSFGDVDAKYSGFINGEGGELM
jgi:hypothetical protein